MPSSADDALLAKTAAYLAAAGRQQKEIAAALEVSQPTVSRMLAQARDSGWLVMSCALDSADIDAVQRHVFAEHAELWDRLTELQPNQPTSLLSVHVCMPAIDSTNPFQAFGASAAWNLAPYLHNMVQTGVAWGRTVSAAASACRMHFRNKPVEANKVLFFPTCGEPANSPGDCFSASANARSFHTAVNVEADDRLVSLGPIAARIPKRFSSSETAIIRKFQMASMAYKRVFVGKNALCRTLDSFITSGGTYDSRSKNDACIADIVHAEQISHEELASLTVGDLGGVAIPKEKLNRSDIAKVVGINERWTGIGINEVQVCAKDAVQKNRVGVVFVACGASKALIVQECIRRGLLNRLIIDHSLATSLLQRLRKQ